jgi:hypothetical protein
MDIYNVNNVYGFQKKAVLVVRIIGEGGGLKKRRNFRPSFLKLHYRYLDKIFFKFFPMNSSKWPVV